MLNEKNIDNRISFLFGENKDLIKAYKTLEKETKDIKGYNLVRDNLRSFFIHYLIKNKIDLEQFSNVMSYFYKNSTKSELGRALNNFFVPDDPNISLKDFVKLDKNNNNQSVWDNMNYLFMDYNEENINGKRLALDKNNLPYLLAILNEADDNTVDALWYAGYGRFLYNFRNDIEPIKPLIEMANTNSAFQKSVDGEYANFFETLLSDIGKRSYDNEIYPNQNKETYKLLAKYIENIDHVIGNCMVKIDNKYGEPEIKTDLGLINFCLKVEEIDTVSIVNKKFKELYDEAKYNKYSDTYDKAYAIHKVLSKFGITIDVSFEKHDFKIDCSRINLKKNYKDNFIYLKLIERKINNHQDFSIDSKFSDYIINSFNKPQKDKILDKVFGIRSLLSQEKIVPYIKIHSTYQELDKSLEKKEPTKGKKAKI